MGSKFGRPASVLGTRSERERVILIAALGLLVSLLVITAIVINTRSSANATQDQKPGVLGEQSALGTVTVLAPERLVRAGTKLSDVRFKEVYWPRHQVPGDAIMHPSEFASYYAKADLQPGVPVQRANITNQIMTVSLPLTPGMRAVSIEVDATSGLEGHALPGTRVDIVLTYHEEEKLTSKVIVQNARVLSYGGDLTPANKRSVIEKATATISKTITLEVATEDALKIQTARQMGRLSLIMRASDDQKAIETVEVDQNRVGGREQKSTKGTKQAQCTRGKMRMGGKEYVIDCNGKINELVESSEP